MSEEQNGLSERLAKPTSHRRLRNALIITALVMTAATIFWIHRLLSFDDTNLITTTSSQIEPTTTMDANSPDPALPTTNTTNTEKAILFNGTPNSIDVKCSGGLAKDTNDNLVRHGKWTYEFNTKIMEGQFSLGSREGQWLGWYPSGEKAFEGKMKNDERNDRWTFWHKNGAKEAEGNFDNGAYSGPWKYWFENGKIRCEGFYKQGKKTGSWKLYNQKSEITSIIKYDSDGKQVASTAYPASEREEVQTKNNFPLRLRPDGDGYFPHPPDLDLFSRDDPSW